MFLPCIPKGSHGLPTGSSRETNDLAVHRLRSAACHLRRLRCSGRERSNHCYCRSPKLGIGPPARKEKEAIERLLFGNCCFLFGGCISRSDVVCNLQNNRPFCQGIESYRFNIKRRLCASLSETEDRFISEQAEWPRKVSSLQEKTVDAMKKYPWTALCGRFLERTSDLVLIPGKWLAIPVLVMSTVNELLYTLTMKKDIFIPLGLVLGFLLAKVVGGAAVDVVRENPQEGRSAAWPLIPLALLFLLLKFSGPYLPSWPAAFVPHMANAGLLKTLLQYRKLHKPSLT